MSLSLSSLRPKIAVSSIHISPQSADILLEGTCANEAYHVPESIAYQHLVYPEALAVHPIRMHTQAVYTKDEVMSCLTVLHMFGGRAKCRCDAKHILM